jgi:hypothetical protein
VRVAEALAPRIGRQLAGAVVPSRSSPRQAPGRPTTIAKRRCWFGPLLIGPGNL